MRLLARLSLYATEWWGGRLGRDDELLMGRFRRASSYYSLCAVCYVFLAENRWGRHRFNFCRAGARLLSIPRAPGSSQEFLPGRRCYCTMAPSLVSPFGRLADHVSIHNLRRGDTIALGMTAEGTSSANLAEVSAGVTRLQVRRRFHGDDTMSLLRLNRPIFLL